MRKQLAIGLSLLALTGMGGVSESSFVLVKGQGVSQQYTHLIEASRNQTFEPMSGAGFGLSLPNRSNFQTASVQFIAGGRDLTFEIPEFPDNSVANCKQFGYTLTSCSTGNPSVFCPYNSAYFKECCDVRYKYDRASCIYPNTVSGDSCGGKFMCYCDRSLYPITSCTAPMIPDGYGCVEEGVKYYDRCICPSQYNQTCTEQNQEGVGQGCTQNGVTYYTSCQCKSGYNMTCSDLGPVTPSDYCLKDGIRYYRDCKTCENKCTLDKCPAGVFCEYEDCSQKYCDIGCATGYIEWCSKPETNCTSLGYTASASQCSNGYIACPYDASKVYCWTTSSSSN